MACHHLHDGGGAPPPNGAAPPAGTPEEPEEADRPVLMSTDSPGLSHRERELLKREQDRYRLAIARRIDKLERHGMPKARADEFRERLGGYTLSLDGNDAPVQTRLERDLALYARALKDVGAPALRQRLLSTAAVAERPDEKDAREKDPDEADLEERAARVSSTMPPRRR